ncbi:TonB-dependent receptor [Longimicrobium sp.]|uniref:TonB-dependent receptor n=1 Tax=Longimicrobium sp. TaxID=2029185 RepID=UPI002C877AB2|nr:TonB-dependent receptor [Longimicrobium sp.]HSU12823.1 TonB-dependent receptor [Longimicrobium sp.]
MQRTICLSVLLLAAAAGSAAAQQDTIPARPDTTAAAVDSAAADSAAIVRELQGQAPGAAEGADAVAQQGGGPAGPAQRLLPDISVVGDFVGDLSPDGSTQEGGERASIREIEIAAQAAVDPYFRGDVFLGISDLEGISIEQAYLTTTSLPYGLEARLGRFLMPFGKLNTTHRHDLHTIEYPWVIQRFLSPDGIKGTGIYGSKVFAPFGFYQELQVTAVDRLGETPDDLVPDVATNQRLSGLGYSARLRNYVDLSQSTNFELSFSAMTGKVAQPVSAPVVTEANAIGQRQTTVGADLTYRWRPLQQGLYRSLIVQAEVMRQMNADPGSTVTLADGTTATYLGPRRDFTGAYGFARWQLTQRTFLGARYDWVQDPLNDGDALNAVSGVLEFFPSEFSKLAASYERYMPGGGLDAVNRILLQATFALGPHKPHPF